MKRFKHYAWDAAQPQPLPFGCRWVRVVDFNPMGTLDLSQNGVATMPTSFSNNQFAVPLEHAAIRLNDRDPALIYAHSIFRMFQDASTTGEKSFTTLELQGDIEVEAGEYLDADPGPLRFGQVSSPFCFATRSRASAFLYTPKNAKSFTIRISAPLAPLTSVRIAPIFSATFLANSGAPGNGLFSAWEPGAVLDQFKYTNPPTFLNIQTGIVRTSLIASGGTPIFSAGAAQLGPAAFAIQVAFVDSGQPTDDMVNQSYVRVFPPTVGFQIFLDDGTLGAGANLMTVMGYANCAY